MTMPDCNSPVMTSPLYASDEHIATYAMADYPVLCPKWSVLASGRDGSFQQSAPWVLNSASVNFEAQGVEPQMILVVTGPRNVFEGGCFLYAIDSVSGTAATLRTVGQPLGVGQPPALQGNIAAVSFWVPSLRPQIDDATFRIKDLFCIDEQQPFRGTPWVYAGVEDDAPAPRIFRDLVVYTTLADLYENAMRDQTENGDFARKAKRYRCHATEAKERIDIRWGPTGNSATSTNISGCKLSR